MFEIHSLLHGKKKEIGYPKGIRKYFDVWKELAQKHGQNTFDFDSFCAGFIIGNNAILKEQFLEEARMNRRYDGEFDNPNIY